MTHAAAGRDPALDHARLALMLLVVFGHVLEPLIGRSDLARGVYVFLYAFHMPAFVALSGHLSRRDASPLRTLLQLGVPYVLFQLLYVSFDAWAFGRPWTLGFWRPYWILWFLVSLATWRLLLPLLSGARWTLALAVGASLAGGAGAAIGYEGSASRTLVFFPFFLAGFFLPRESLARLRTPRVRVLALGVLGSGLALALHLHSVDARWLYGSQGYAALGVGLLDGALRRGGLMLASAALTLAFLAWMPGAATRFTSLGTRTLYVFLAHGFVVRGFEAAGLYSAWSGAALAAFSVSLLAFTSPGVWLLQPLVEPRWLTRLGRRREVGLRA